MRRQVLQAIWQMAGEPPAASTHDHHVEELLLLRQVTLDFHRKRRVGKEVGQKQAKEAVPVS
jgi:hypothetical protein